MKKGILLRDKCPICGSDSSKSIFNRSFNEKLLKDYLIEGYQGNADIEFLDDVRFEIVKCHECNFSYQKYVLDEDRLNELYNKWIDPKLAQEWDEEMNTEKKSHYLFLLDYAKKLLKRESGRIRVLDFGAGFGSSLFTAKEMGFDTYAYEYSNERNQFLKENGIKTIDLSNEMLFDFIIVNQVLEHLTVPDETLKVIISKLNNNGLMFIDVPNCSHLEKKLGKTDKITDAKEFKRVLLDASVTAFQHINFFTSYNLRLLFKKQGIEPVSPFKQAFVKPITVKSFIRPFYWHHYGTGYFLVKA